MTQKLKIKLGWAEGALVRLLGHTERRGFPLVGVSALPEGTENLMVDMTIESNRPVEQLIHQLNKLYDVKHVERTQ